MRLDQNYKGGPLKFFLAIQNVYLVLQNCTGKIVPDEEKIGALNASMYDSCFSSVCTTIEILALQTKTPMDYASYSQSLITFTENLKPSTSRTCKSNKLQKTGEVRKEVEIQAVGKINPERMTTVHGFPRMSFYKLPREEREKQIKVRAEAKRARETQALQMNFLQNTQPQMPTTPSTTMLTFAPGTQVMTLVSAGISNEENNQSGGTPTVCGIMASQTQPREVNSSMTILPEEGSKQLYLIDGGSNNGLAGAGMRLYEMTEHPEHVDIISASDDVQDRIISLPIDTYCAVVTSATGKHCL
eukprot:9895612-Ditylum_brightwellii.AAC.1